MLVIWTKEDEEATRTTPKLDTATLSSVMVSNEKSTGEITAGQGPSIETRLTPETNQPDVQANTTSWPLSQRQGSAHSPHTKIFNVRLRSSKHPRYVDVKTRLIALWHRSLRHETSRDGNDVFELEQRGKEETRFHRRDEPSMQQKRPTARNTDINARTER